jgi:aminoglycoside 3-N-acetyltransferase I
MYYGLEWKDYLVLPSLTLFLYALSPSRIIKLDVGGILKMKYLFKRITSTDTEMMKALLGVFAEAFAEPQTYMGAVPGDEYLRRLLQKDYFIALVALAGDKVIGGLVAYELEKFEQERSEIYIYDLAVEESHRRNGVAKNLINELKCIARRRGAWVIFVQADLADTTAIRLYESLGKKEGVFQFDIPV